MPPTQDLSLQKITGLRRVGPATRARLAKLEIETLHDLLFHLPARYEDRSRITPVRELHIGDTALVLGFIVSQKPLYRKGRMAGLECVLQDKHGDTLSLEWRQVTAYQRTLFSEGKTIRCYGTVRPKAHNMCIYHPEYIPDEAYKDDRLTPVYPSTSGISQTLWRQILNETLGQLDDRQPHCVLPLPPQSEIANQGHYDILNSVSTHEAIRYLHTPTIDKTKNTDTQIAHYRQRLACEELLAHYLHTRKITRLLKKQSATAFGAKDNEAEQIFLRQLPFELTKAQRKSAQEILHDLGQDKAMHRILRGDVSCGKTVVAAWAALRVIAHKAQVAVMVPTEILREQHYHTFVSWFQPLSLRVAQLHSTQTATQRTAILNDLRQGKIDLIIGTHTLLQKDVHFQQLGLNIIDEQHLFGVHQRLLLQQKSPLTDNSAHKPHQLIMSATPIPRTLFMIYHSGLGCSVIDEMPEQRKSVQTALISQNRRDEIIDRVRHACKNGQQAYWVCPFIDQSNTMDAKAVEDVAEQLTQLMPELHVGMVHSRCTSKKRVATMDAFKSGEINLLVATTIIGVGVDIPNANLIIIENAERLGLAQLHQLRGRVGRGTDKGYCLLVYGKCGEHSMRRLKIMRTYSDGGMIAEQDLQMRGPGEVPSTAQSGNIKFKVANLETDQAWVNMMCRYGDWLEQAHPECATTLAKRWYTHHESYAMV